MAVVSLLKFPYYYGAFVILARKLRSDIHAAKASSSDTSALTRGIVRDAAPLPDPLTVEGLHKVWRRRFWKKVFKTQVPSLLSALLLGLLALLLVFLTHGLCLKMTAYHLLAFRLVPISWEKSIKAYELSAYSLSWMALGFFLLNSSQTTLSLSVCLAVLAVSIALHLGYYFYRAGVGK